MAETKSSSSWKPSPRSILRLQVNEESRVKDIKASSLLDENGNLSYEKLLEYSYKNSSLNKDRSKPFSDWKEDFLSNYDLNTLYLDDESNWVMFSSDDEFVNAFQKAEQEAKILGQSKIFPKLACYSSKIWKKSPMKLNSCAVTILKCKTRAIHKGMGRPSKKARKDSKLLKELEQCVLTIGEGIHTIVEESIKLRKNLKKNRKKKNLSKSSHTSPDRKNLVVFKDEFSQLVILTFQENISVGKMFEMVTELGSSLEKCILVLGEGVHKVVEGSICLSQNINIKETKRVLKSAVLAASSVFSETKKNGDIPKKFPQVTHSRAIVESKMNASEFAISATTLRGQSVTKKAKVAPLFSDVLMSGCPESYANQAGTTNGQISDLQFNKFLSWYRLATAVQAKNYTQIKTASNKVDLDPPKTEHGVQINEASDLNSILCSTNCDCLKKGNDDRSENISQNEVQKIDSPQIIHSSKAKDSGKPSYKHDDGILTDLQFERFLSYWSPCHKQKNCSIKVEDKPKHSTLRRKRSHEDFEDKQSQNMGRVDQVEKSGISDDSSYGKETGRLSDNKFSKFLSWWSTCEKKDVPCVPKTRNIFIERISNRPPRKQNMDEMLGEIIAPFNDGLISDKNLDYFMQFWAPDLKPTIPPKSERSQCESQNKEPISENDEEPDVSENGLISDNDFNYFMQFWAPDQKPKVLLKSEKNECESHNKDVLSENEEEPKVIKNQESSETKDIISETPRCPVLSISNESLHNPDTEEVSVADLETISGVSVDKTKNAEDEKVNVINDLEILLTDGMVIVEERSFNSSPQEVTDDEWSVDFNFEVESVETVLSEENLVSSIKSKNSDQIVLVPSKSVEVVSINSSVSSEDDDFSLVSENEFLDDDNITLVSEINSTFSMPSRV